METHTPSEVGVTPPDNTKPTGEGIFNAGSRVQHSSAASIFEHGADLSLAHEVMSKADRHRAMNETQGGVGSIKFMKIMIPLLGFEHAKTALLTFVSGVEGVVNTRKEAFNRAGSYDDVNKMIEDLDAYLSQSNSWVARYALQRSGAGGQDLIRMRQMDPEQFLLTYPYHQFTKRVGSLAFQKSLKDILSIALGAMLVSKYVQKSVGRTLCAGYCLPICVGEMIGYAPPELREPLLMLRSATMERGALQSKEMQESLNAPYAHQRTLLMHTGGLVNPASIAHHASFGPHGTICTNTLFKVANSIAHYTFSKDPMPVADFMLIVAKSLHPSIALSVAGALSDESSEREEVIAMLRLAHSIHTIRCFLNRNLPLTDAELFELIVIMEHEPKTVRSFHKAVQTFVTVENLGSLAHDILRDFAIITTFLSHDIPLLFDRFKYCVEFVDEFIEKAHVTGTTYVIEPVVEACKRIVKLLETPTHSPYAHQLVQHNYVRWWNQPFYHLEETVIQ